MQILIETVIKPLSDHKYFTSGASLHGIMSRLNKIPPYVRSQYSRLRWTLTVTGNEDAEDLSYRFPALAEEMKVFQKLINPSGGYSLEYSDE
jgi:hypothetical protein